MRYGQRTVAEHAVLGIGLLPCGPVRPGNARGKGLCGGLPTRWRAHVYEVRRGPLTTNSNWLAARDFVAKVRAHENSTVDVEDPITSFPPEGEADR